MAGVVDTVKYLVEGPPSTPSAAAPVTPVAPATTSAGVNTPATPAPSTQSTFTTATNTSLLAKYGMTNAASRVPGGGAGDAYIATLPAYEQAQYLSDRRAAGDPSYTLPAAPGNVNQPSVPSIIPQAPSIPVSPSQAAPVLSSPGVQVAGAAILQGNTAGGSVPPGAGPISVLTDEDIAAQQENPNNEQLTVLGG